MTNRRRKNRTKRRKPPVMSRVQAKATIKNTSGTSLFMRTLIVLTAGMPIAVADIPTTILSAFSMYFNYYKYFVDNIHYYAGAYCQFKITPGCLLRQSPLLAVDGEKYTFPGYPVSVRYVSITIKNTAAIFEYVGKWAAVYIPYLEAHDDKHYKDKIADLSFAEVAAMPYAKTGLSKQPLRINYRMRDKSAYCSRPRQLSDAIGVVIIVWDNLTRDHPTEKPINSQFNCEIELRSGTQPHVIFGPQHRVSYASSVFEPIRLTDGNVELVVGDDGSREFHQVKPSGGCSDVSIME